MLDSFGHGLGTGLGDVAGPHEGVCTAVIIEGGKTNHRILETWA